MVFSSSLFLFYFLPVFLVVYFFTPARFKNGLILLASLIFYAWGAPLFVFVLSAAVIFDFYIAKLIHACEGKKRKLMLTAGIVVNVSMLVYFKYFNFFADNINHLLAFAGIKAIAFARVALPIGISFFVFHELSYIIDIYRRVKPPLDKITDYALYIFLFPQLIAGPIIRFNEIADQIQNRNYQDNIDNKLAGMFRFAIGLAKKVLIANVLGEVADKLFNAPAETLTFYSSWTGVLCYTFQIYFDFSGYSDMAIGLALTMGFKFPENFNSPYTAQSVTEFWGRWHMSLSRWMRDYLYIPLGGNRVSKTRMYLNLWLVFLISGFWHGAQWSFIAWGAYHGFFLMLERMFLLRITERTGKVARTMITFLTVMCGWVFFRADSLPHAFGIFRRMFSFDFSSEGIYLSPRVALLLFFAAVCSFAASSAAIARWQERSYLPAGRMGTVSVRTAFALLAIAVCFGEITSSGFNPFIYFKF